ncbi:MAG: LysR family transcriptional regulator [Lachnospiraceae bacterium]|nr:LysR family transcriptional regulator [Lachnospiraceae bacterium]
MDINYELYKVFYHVAKSLSFSEAAAGLYISQSAVSQSVKLLEKRLGQTLFVRNTKRVSLTPEGEMLLKHIEPAIQLITRGENQLSRDASEGGMQLRIAASDTICRYVLVPFFRDLHERFPDVHINILNGTSPHCAQMLESGQVDLIVANSPNESLTGNMQIRPIRDFSDVFVGNPSHYPDCFTSANGKPRTFTMKELLTYPLLMLSKRSATSSFLHEQFQKHSLELVPSIELSSNDLLLDLARIGLGIACVPDFCIPQTEAILQRLTIKETLPKRKLVIAYDEKWPLSLPAQALIEELTGGGEG